MSGLPTPGTAVLLVLVAFVAGTQNALAGGGSFLTFPVLLFAGLDARAANITSTVALFPGQVATGLVGRRDVSGAANLSFRALFGLSLVGGGLGAVLLLATPASVFARMVPWLILFATAVFAWGSFRRRPAAAARTLPPTLPRWAAALAQFAIGIYGGYFGGGIGFLILAALTLAGLKTRAAAATKNVLTGVMNAAAVVIFAFSPAVHWVMAVLVGVGAIAGGQVGAWALRRVNDRALRIAIVGVGLALTVAMFWRLG